MAVLAVLLFAVPLGAVVWLVDRGERYAALQSLATRSAAAVPDSAITADAVTGVVADPSTGVYAPDGSRIAGAGPQTSPVAARVGADGRPHRGRIGDRYVVGVPVTSDGAVVAAVEVSAPVTSVLRSAARTWGLMAIVGACVLAAAAVSARREARRLLEPLEMLAEEASRLGEGDFSVMHTSTGLEEVDAVGATLTATAERLGALITRERAFSVDASHQLRTPLAGLALTLEIALSDSGAQYDGKLRTSLHTALERTRALEGVVADLLAVRRDTERPLRPVDVAAEAREIAASWTAVLAGAGRGLSLSVDDSAVALASPSCIRHVLDVLLDNAARHGQGRVELAVDAAPDWVRVQVGDEGLAGLNGSQEWFSRGGATSRTSGHGVGLSLARSLAEADGGRLVFSGGRFTLLLVAADGLLVPASSR